MNLKYRMNGNKKTEKDSTIFYEIERIEIVKNNMVIQGWAISKEGMKDVRFRVEDSKGESVKIKVTRKTRRDGVESDFGVAEEENCGFKIEFETSEETEYKFYITDGIRKKKSA